VSERSLQSVKVLLASPTPPPMAGIERFGQDVLTSELGREFTVELLDLRIPLEWRPRAATQAHCWNIVKRDGLSSTFRVLCRVAYCFLRQCRILRRGRFQILHVLSTGGYGFFRNAVHILGGRRRGVKTVFHLLGQIDDLYRGSPAWRRRIICWCLDRADVLIVQSPLLADFLRKITRRPVYSILNGVRARELRPPSGYAHSSGPTIEVLTLGVLGVKKGTFDLLEAAARLLAEVPLLPLSFTFVGGGEVEYFRELAARKSLNGQVRFLGAVCDSERVRLLQQADIFVLPSRAEGLPLAILEAMAAGLPIVASQVGAVPEVVGSDNGFLVPPGDIDSLVHYIRVLASDPAVRTAMGRFNAQEAQQKYSLDRVIAEIRQVYTMICPAQVPIHGGD